MAKFYQGYFKPVNPKKYIGNVSNIIYRSSYELKLMLHLDRHPDVIQWASEEFCIPYKSPYTGKYHRYFPDFWVKYKNTEGKVVVKVIEIKPASQTKKPKVRKGKMPKTPKYLYEVRQWGINKSKWEAAEKFCADKGWHFQIMTEKELGIK